MKRVILLLLLSVGVVNASDNSYLLKVTTFTGDNSVPFNERLPVVCQTKVLHPGGQFHVRNFSCMAFGGDMIQCTGNGVTVSTHGEKLTQLTLGFEDKDYIITYVKVRQGR